MDHELFVCECESVDHQLIITSDPDEDAIFFSIYLTTYRPWFERLKAAFNYVFRNRRIEFDEVILDHADQERLIQVLQSHWQKHER